MSMYALLRNNPTPKMANVEEAFHGTARDWLEHRQEVVNKDYRARTNNSDLILSALFVCVFRKFVSLHRIQTHTGGIQDFHCGETHRHTKI